MKSSVMTSPSGAWRAWLNEETLQPRDRQMMGMLLPLGIEKGKEFKPDAATVAQLKAAAAEALAWLMDKAATDVTPWWPNGSGAFAPRPLPCRLISSGRRPIILAWMHAALLCRSIFAQLRS
jgi:hypothetical protein